MAITAKPTSYTVNTGHAKCPDHLYMLEDSTGATTVADDVGSLNMTADNSSMWNTDATYGQILRFVSASSQKAITANTFSATTGVCLVAIVKTASATNPAGDQVAAGIRSSTAGTYGGIRYKATTGYVQGVFDTNGTTNIGQVATDYYDGSWHFIAIKTNDTTGTDSVAAISVDGANWTTTQLSGSGDADVGLFNRLALGCNAQATPATFFDGDVLSLFVYKDDYSTWDNTWVSSLYGDPWQFLNTSTIQAFQYQNRVNPLLRM